MLSGIRSPAVAGRRMESKHVAYSDIISSRDVLRLRSPRIGGAHYAQHDVFKYSLYYGIINNT